MAKIRKGLGKGLGALMPNNQDLANENSAIAKLINLVNVSKIRTNPNQPRRNFDLDALEALKSSIDRRGLIQPITVRQIPGGYELISGERRLRVIKDLKWEEVPAYVIEVDSDAEMLELAIVENVLREDLNPIEIANSYNRLIEEYRYTQEQVAESVGKKRSTVTNMLRLLKLPVPLQDYVREERLDTGHAKVLLGIEDRDEMLEAAKSVIEKKFNVRDTEKLVKSIQNKGIKPPTKERITEEEQAILNSISNELMQSFGTKVRINAKNGKSGKVEIEYYSKDDFQRIIELLNSVKN